MRCLFTVIFCLLFLAASALADEPDEVRLLLKGRIDAVLVVLQDKAMDKARRDERIIEIIAPIFDYQIIRNSLYGSPFC